VRGAAFWAKGINKFPKNIMNLPKTVTNAVLKTFAKPDELFQVRVLIRNQTNHADYVIRGKNRIARKYMAKYDPAIGCHTLDIPLSLWMEKVPARYRDNDSVAHDIMGLRNTKLFPLVVLVTPLPGAEARLEAFKAFEGALLAPEAPKPAGGTPAAERMRLMRERKKAKADALKALLQPT